MIIVVVVFSLTAALVCIVVGAHSALAVEAKRKEVIEAVRPPPKPGPAAPSVTNQSLAASMDSLSKLAVALKDLDRVAQMFTLALGFTAVAAVAVGLDAVTQAVGS